MSRDSPQKVFSVGDMHGDFGHFQLILSGLGLATFEGNEVRWTGGDSILVSTGDTVDRGEHARSIYLAFQELARQAPEFGGEVVNLAGNHELMNLQGDLRYVHRSEYDAKGEYGGREQRENEWSRSGLIGADIRQRYLAAAVRGGILFVHGGLEPATLSLYGSGPEAIDAMNQKVKELFDADTVAFNHKLFGQRGPFWNRFFADHPESQICGHVDETLQIANAQRMVVGHTPQEDGVGTKCMGPNGPKFILGDTVISRAYERSFGFTRPSAIEYDGDSVTAIYFSENAESPRRVSLTGSDGNRSEF